MRIWEGGGFKGITVCAPCPVPLTCLATCSVSSWISLGSPGAAEVLGAGGGAEAGGGCLACKRKRWGETPLTAIAGRCSSPGAAPGVTWGSTAPPLDWKWGRTGRVGLQVPKVKWGSFGGAPDPPTHLPSPKALPQGFHLLRLQLLEQRPHLAPGGTEGSHLGGQHLRIPPRQGLPAPAGGHRVPSPSRAPPSRGRGLLSIPCRRGARRAGCR